MAMSCLSVNLWRGQYNLIVVGGIKTTELGPIDDWCENNIGQRCILLFQLDNPKNKWLREFDDSRYFFNINNTFAVTLFMLKWKNYNVQL
jgi:hypothetical protein